jgi:sialic acid synthase SpsE
MNVAGREIGPQSPTFLIAEIGVNHDGSVERALELVDVAARCGADAVKLQVFQARALMHGSGQFAAYQRQQCDDADPAAMLRKYELAGADLRRVVAAIRDRGMAPLATPFSLPDVDTVAELNLPAVKIASPDLVNKPLLAAAARLGSPMFVSTGAATLDEVRTAADWLTQWRAPFALLHCVSSYPAPSDAANLCWIGELAAAFNVPVGYSDHTTEILAGALSVAAGACVVEKHLTYDRAAAGPDHAASADPQQFADYVRHIRLADVLRGQPGKRVLPPEEDVRRVSRQSLVLQADLAAGQRLSRAHLIIQRPAAGIPAASLEAAVGRVAKTDLSAGTMLQWGMLSDAA